MAARRPPAVAVLLVWITLILLLLLHGWRLQLWRPSSGSDVAGTYTADHGSLQLWRSSSGSDVAGTYTADHGGSLSGSSGRATPRKMLASKFDFSPFGVHHHHRGVHRHRHRHHGHHSPGDQVRPQPSAGGSDDEIDPRYGVEKRLVPTGPNPLHH